MELTLLLIVAVALINLFATRAVFRSAGNSPMQQAWQIALVWFVPVLGAVVCMAFASSQARDTAVASTLDPLYSPGDGQAPQEGVAIGLCGCSGGDGGGGDGGGGD